MKGSHRKQHAVVTFIIHALQLPKHYSDPFIIEYKRGDKTGLTERALAGTGETEVTFEKRFRVAVTFYISKRDHEIRRKKIAFTVYRFLNGSERKVFGKFEVDVSQFHEVTVPKVVTVPVESPHSEKSSVVMSFSSVTTHTGSQSGGNTMTEDNLTSLSEAIQLMTDKQDEWDVSETATPEAKAAISEFFRERERVKREHALADFQGHGTPDKRRRPMIPLSRGGGKRETTGGLTSFLTQGKPGKPRPSKRRKSRDEYERKDSEKKNELDQQSVTTLLRSVLIKHWDSSPMSLHGVPKAASALFGAVLYTKLLEADTHIFEVCETVIGDFLTRYRAAVIVDGGLDIEKWYVSLCLLKLIGWQSGLVRERVDFFCCDFLPICRRQLEEAVDRALEPIKDIAVDIIEKVDVDQAIQGIQSISDKIKVDSDVGTFFSKRVWCAFDGLLVDLLLKTPQKCTFGNAAMWNTILTILRDDVGVDFPLFRQAVSVLMMGAALCSKPDEKEVICKDLSNEVVLKILVAQTPDDFMPMENDTQEYCAHYNLTIGDAATSFAYLDYEGDFSEIDKEIDYTRWIEAKFDDATWKGFRFLQFYFTKQ